MKPLFALSVLLFLGSTLLGCPGGRALDDPYAPGRAYDLNDLQFGQAIAQCSDEGVVLAGVTVASEGYPRYTVGVAKIDDGRSVEWSRRLDNVAPSYTGKAQEVFVAPGPAAGILVAGSSERFSSETEEPMRVVLHYLDAEGQTLWEKPFGPDDCFPLGCVRAEAGYAILASGVADAFVAGTDETGDQEWLTSLRWQNEPVLPRDLAVASDGALAVVARSPRSGSTAGQTLVFLLNAAGEVQWANSYAVDGDPDVSAIAFFPDGEIGVAGTTQVGRKAVPFALRIDRLGALVWTQPELRTATLPVALEEYTVADMLVDASGRTVLLGSHRRAAVSSPDYFSPFLMTLDGNGGTQRYAEFAAYEHGSALALLAPDSYGVVGSASPNPLGTEALLKLYEFDAEGELTTP